MSYQEPPVGVPPPQGHPPEGYVKDVGPPPGYQQQAYPPPYAQPPPQQHCCCCCEPACLEGCLSALCFFCLLDGCF